MYKNVKKTGEKNQEYKLVDAISFKNETTDITEDKMEGKQFKEKVL